MRYSIEFSEEKNLILKETRGIGFNDIIVAYQNGHVLDNLKNKNYPNQRVLVVWVKRYVYAVPYVVDKKRQILFLKTIYPSRVLTKKYKKENL